MQVIDYSKQNKGLDMTVPYVIGVAGGSGSGKTFFARELQKILGDEYCTIIYQDNYYIDQSHRFDGDGGSVNFDHPDSLDFGLLAIGLSDLKKSKSIKVPLYEFSSHTRKKETIDCHPKKIILVDGILILDSSAVRAQLDESIFFDTPEQLRYERRLDRDVNERGRTAEGVKKQFDLQVKPMHNLFVEPSKNFAQTIVKDFGDYKEAIEFYTRKLL